VTDLRRFDHRDDHGRIVELLENEPRLTLIVAGRSPAKAAAFCTA